MGKIKKFQIYYKIYGVKVKVCLPKFFKFLIKVETLPIKCHVSLWFEL